jgi:hypothetical protein
MSSRFPRLLWDQTHGIDLGAPPSVSPRGRRLVDRDLAVFLFRLRGFVFHPGVERWLGATDFRATLVPGTSLVSDRVRIRRGSRRPRPVARHGLGHKPP